ncbi:YwpF family protein [Kurthia massiliensis]|uniref:YwpF family protein n=1 Tax=Kurthia massiliensis TaxID=1033739 RepID=UPI001EEF9E3A|nr:YwpF family protein [Kurthia massiliensis]
MKQLKTFKLMSFEVFQGDGFKRYFLEDGIIINQESSHQSWVLEIFCDAEYADDFKHLINTDTILEVRAVISYPDNEPAAFRVLVQGLKYTSDGRISVLFKGTLKTQNRQQYAELLLEHLIKEGLESDALVDRFARDMKERPRIKP